ncbi:MAG: glycerate kinase [Thermoprotei archaeon]|nr:MAG: glycerate kinase [Thermoprotei archaeon]
MILNKDSLLEHGEIEARRKILEILEAGLKAADPSTAVRKSMSIHEEKLFISPGDLRLSLSDYRKIIVVGAGKASGGMAEALEEILSEKIECGLVIVPRGYSRKYSCRKIRLVEADHPVPSPRNVVAAEELLNLVESNARPDTLIICLISGGGSALLTKPRGKLELDDIRLLTELLLKSGANIVEVNTVRKHLSEVKGGFLAKRAFPATVLSLIISDVVGDPIEYIASGPTAPDPSTFKDAVEVLKRYGFWESVPSSVRNFLEKGVRGEVDETPKPGDPIFERVFNVIVASNRISLNKMAEKARELSLNVLMLTSFLEGEARHVGRVLASIAKEARFYGEPVSRPCAILAGGETTVTVVGKGKGGRNQELVLGFALGVKSVSDVAFASLGSDGIDGVTDAAGAVCDGQTVDRGLATGLDPYAYLSENNTYEYFKSLDDLIFTGPTGTNVNDLSVAVIL